jgi:hypothetical protein
MNQSNENQNDRSIRVELNQTIDAPVQEVFPLACPVMEYKWIPDWKCELIHCPNGQAELGVIFKEIFSAPILADSVAQRTTWTAVLYEPEKYRVHYKLDNMTYIPINKRGIAAMEKGGKAKIKLMLSILSLMLKHYCEKGEMVKTSEILKLASQVEEMTTKDRIRSLLNKLLRMVVQDDDRKKFEKDLPIMKVKST